MDVNGDGKMRKILAIFVMLTVLASFIYAQERHEDFTEAMQIIEDKIPCDNLSEDQFEILGDYFMEQMHPGEAHEIMDERMGGEGSESLRLMHINMGKAFYCGENYGMMGYGMMGSGMMGNYQNNMMGNYNGYGMMGNNYNTTRFGYGWSLYNILYLVLLVGLIILVYLGIVRLWKKPKKK